ncbi:MAG: PEP-CTERM sorting domain-containing protein [Xenococcaceae cyanobacterium]
MPRLVQLLVASAFCFSFVFSALSAFADPSEPEIADFFSTLQEKGFKISPETTSQWTEIYHQLKEILTAEQLQILHKYLQQGSDLNEVVAQMNLSSEQKEQLYHLSVVYGLPDSSEVTKVPEPSSVVGLLAFATLAGGVMLKRRRISGLTFHGKS